MFEHKDEYVLMHPNGKLVSNKTKSGLTVKLDRALIGSYDSMLYYCQEEDRDIAYTIHHKDNFANDNSGKFRVSIGGSTKNLRAILRNVDRNHYILKILDEYDAEIERILNNEKD